MTHTTADAGRTAGHAQNVRDALDQIDETPFGKVGKLLDRMADEAQRAVNERNHLVGALDGMVLVCGRTGDAFYDFEEQAAAFQAETGWMRPGKDSAMHYGDDRDDFEARRLKYAAWVQTKIEAGRDVLKSRSPHP